jgi:hypothetical protein
VGIARRRADSPLLVGLRVTIRHDRDLDPVFGAELSGDELPCSGDMSHRVVPEPALSNCLVPPSPRPPISDIAKGHHARRLLEVVVEPLHDRVELGAICGSQDFSSIRDIRKRAIDNASNDLGGVLESHVPALFALRYRRRHSAPDVSGKAKAARHVIARMT